MYQQQRQQYQIGAVSLFVVVFSTLLMIVITLGFIQLMLKDQRQATASDLSQSAYDSARSGVEDAKRLLLLDQACRSGSASSAVNCGAVATAIASDDCNTVSVGLFGRDVNDPPEVMIEQNPGDNDLRQAYTCVKIAAVTKDYKYPLGDNESNIVPLRGVSAFNKVRISWFTLADISNRTTSTEIGFPEGGDVELPRINDDQWALNYPALLRAQLMQLGSSFTLDEFDGNNNASTMFLYPANAGNSLLSFTSVRKDKEQQTPDLVECVDTFDEKTYACEVTILLPAPADGDVANRNAFLRLSALYNSADYKLELLNGSADGSDGTVVPFDHVQPEVDSTGRANDMFRRVKSRIEFASPFIYPEAAVDIQGGLCKTFTITDVDTGYAPGQACTQ